MLFFAFIMSGWRDQHLSAEGEMMKDVRWISCLVNQLAQSLDVLGRYLLVEREFDQLEGAGTKLEPLLVALIDVGQVLNGHSFLFR